MTTATYSHDQAADHRRHDQAAVITGSGHAFPDGHSQQEYWDRFYAHHSGENRWARSVFLGAGCAFRHTAVDPTQEDISGWTTGARMARYLDEALPLATRAAQTALSAAGVDADELGMLAVVSCTGYTTPGLDIRLAEGLEADPSLQRLIIGHMGCYAALPGLGAVSDFVTARRRPALLVCVELASLHVQPPSMDLEQVVAHALFSDGAAAVVVEPGYHDSEMGGSPVGLRVIDIAARTDVTTAELMRWDVTDRGFRMRLSRRVPDVLARHVGPLVDDLLSRHGLQRHQIDGWAVHPGGPRIVDVVADRLQLSDQAIRPSRQVLEQHGNCSSATILVVLDAVQAATPIGAGRYLIALAFGPGLTLYAALLQG